MCFALQNESISGNIGRKARPFGIFVLVSAILGLSSEIFIFCGYQLQLIIGRLCFYIFISFILSRFVEMESKNR